MTLPTRDTLLALDVADLALPFVRLATGSLDTPTLDTADLALPFVAIAEAAATSTNDSTVTLPTLIGDGATPGVVMANTSDAALAAITASGTAECGLVGSSRNADGTPLSLPALTGSASTAAPTLPAITGSATALAGTIATSAQRLDLTGAAAADPGVTASSALTLAPLLGSGAGPFVSAADLPGLAGEGTALAGTVARSTTPLTLVIGDGTAITPALGGSTLTTPTIAGDGTAAIGTIGASSATLATLIVAAEGFSGALGVSSLTLPVLAADSHGQVQVIGASVLTLPAIVARSSASAEAGTHYQGYALHTQRRALTRYSSVPFNSLARFNGVYLAAGPGGLFVLHGDTDDGALIEATVRLANTDFGDPHLKRVEAMYVNYRTDGDLRLQVITDQAEAYDYRLPGMLYPTLDNQRIKIGRGLVGVYWQFEITNLDGADFTLDHLDPSIQPLSRRIG